MEQPAIRTEGLTRTFGPVTALDGVDLEMQRGTVLALLGPNGAGKTTFVRILSTLLAPSAGRAEVEGFDVARAAPNVRRAIGLTGQFTAVDDDLTADETLRLVGSLLGLSRREAATRSAELLERFDLTQAANRRVGRFSGGMKRRVDLAASLIGRPRILFLDEPSTGLDPTSRRGLWEAVGDLAAQGTSILLTTQYLEEADVLAERVVVIDSGRLVADGTPKQLKARVGGTRVSVKVSSDRSVEARRLLLDEGFHIDVAGESVLRIPTEDAGRAADVVGVLHAASIPIQSLEIVEPTLDDVFFSLTTAVKEG